jgi:hypothetical protein
MPVMIAGVGVGVTGFLRERLCARCVAPHWAPKRFDDSFDDCSRFSLLSKNQRADFRGCALSDKSHIVLKRFEGMAPSERMHPCATKSTP